MIENFIINRRNSTDLEDFISTRNNLYITQDNKRKSVKSVNDLKRLLRESCYSLRKVEKGATKALLFVWKSNGINVNRNYIKVEYDTISDLDDLLMVLNWNFPKEVYVKLDRQSPLIDSFRKKGFKFYHDRGSEVLLFRSRNERVFVAPLKECDEDE